MDARVGAVAGTGQAAAAPFVEVTGLRKSFGPTKALQEVSFKLGMGGTVSLLGPSGCGKTTVLRSIAGLEKPDAGRICLGETVVYDHAQGLNLPPEARQVGMVFQSYAVWPHMTVGQNVAFPLKVRRIAADESRTRVVEALRLVGLDGLQDRPATNLSGGQQQRVALARAIVHQPRLVLFDEPLSNLDAKLRDQMRTELKLLQGRLGFTAVYVTHDQEEALALSDTVIVMNQGRIEGVGAPRELFDHPPTPFVANFLGFDNLFDGVVAGAAGGIIEVRVGDGLTLRCLPRRGRIPGVGEAAVVAIRGDHVRLQSAEGNCYTGRIEACIYAGLTQEYQIQLGPICLRAVAPGDAPLQRGDEVTVSIKPEDCLVFAKTG
jgi:iron(III) transport system ATP-binding protein